MTLKDKSCVPCRGGVPPLEAAAARRLLAEVPGWQIEGPAARIRRRFTFKDYRSVVEFVNRIAEMAETEQHHPDIGFGWGYAEVVFFTHKIAGLHENDFIMAAKVNALFEAA
ncbi:pterin-4-alpha-carbinolamine dehydratase [Plasticicumulans lactativorans]|uniref:Putative pterin-4-alpha-carbinolamine dehydratase n=1 Tax=Plasticicumulans lactativorans TaxID=1133106 RepID=A0A4R2KY93_9GAMM|nr:4a-hydroxytetrahydrobiopterin dehydratase [Plasticicumulans lactativorans]TCO78923.1 pterin-4-alpha-carbinolamine dehydratase [Plasticicumulans lactativorans]